METHPCRNTREETQQSKPAAAKIFRSPEQRPPLPVGIFAGSSGAGSTGLETGVGWGCFILVTLREGVPCRARGGGVSSPRGQKRAGYVKWNQVARSWRSCLLSPARAIKCGIKEETALWLIGPIQEELVPKFFNRGSFYSEPQLISSAAQRGFRGLIKTR